MAKIRIGIAGLGTVGAGVVKILQEKAELLANRAGKSLVVTALSARDKEKDRGINTNNLVWHVNAVDMASNQEVDVVVELIGGADGPAYNLCKIALQNGKHVITANKALIAKHGVELASLAEKHNVKLAFEASVAGGIPALKVIKEGLAGNEFSRISGILNGTCNYILTAMKNTGRSFDTILKEAQSLGYAEADPSFDIDGIDTAHKLSILTSLAYGTPVNIDAMHIEGIRNITLHDIHYAEELGMKIKLLGICSRTEEGIEQRVHPCMIPVNHPMASVDDVLNAVVAEGDSVGKVVLEGRGAGGGPTASAVVADIVDIASGRTSLPFNVPVAALKEQPFVPMEQHEGAYYMRLAVLDKPGVLADITDIFRDEQISMQSFLQKNWRPDEPVQIVLTTHRTQELSMNRAVERIKKIDSVLETPHLIRIEAS